MSCPSESAAPRRSYTLEFKQQAVARLAACANVSALARELGIRRRFLYLWRDQLASGLPPRGRPPRGRPVPTVPAAADEAPSRRVAELERLVARQALELDCFRGALQHIDALRPRSGPSGAAASTAISGPGCSSRAD